MAAIYTVDQTLQVNDYYSKVIKAKKYDNVIQAIIKRGDTPEQWKQQIEVEDAEEGYSSGAPEGDDFNESTLVKRVNSYLEVQLEYFRTQRGFKVTDLAQLLPGYTEKKGVKQLARQIAKDAAELVRSIELTLGSTQEAVERGSETSTVAKTRGMLSWLSKSTHLVQAIPSSYMPKCGITGDITSSAVFTEALLREELTKAALELGDGHLTLTALCGLRLKALMSGWLGKAETVQGFDTVLRRAEPKSRKIELICDEFSYDGVSFRALVCNHLGCTISGTAGTKISVGTKQYYTGAWIRPEAWSIDTLMPLRIRKLENKGGGERGYHEACLRLACRNPLGQFAVVHNAADSSSSSSSS